MTDNQKKAIRQLREAGLGYKSISTNTGMSIGAIRAFIKKGGIEVQKPKPVGGVCPNCGKTITSIPGRKKRRFCSKECGLEWWHQHEALLNRKAVYSIVCPSCGKRFTSYGHSNRKYCSHECYINARFRGVSHDAQ